MRTRSATRRLREANTFLNDGLHSLPPELVEEVLSYLPTSSDLIAAALSCKYLHYSAFVDRLWQQAFETTFSKVLEVLEACPPRWWKKSGWYQRYRHLAKGASFTAQVYNRESDNLSEDFYLSAYEATLSMQQPFSPSNPTFVARYLPMANQKVVENGVHIDRIRKRSPPLSPFTLYQTDLSCLRVHEEVEVQWKAMQEHPFGWWLAVVQDVQPDMLVLVFQQYPDQSPWHAVAVPVTPGTESVVNWNAQYGYIGGARSLLQQEKVQWQAQKHSAVASSQLNDRTSTAQPVVGIAAAAALAAEQPIPHVPNVE